MKELKNILLVIVIQILVYIVLFLGFSFLWRNLNIDSNISLIMVNVVAIIIYIFIYYKVNFNFYYWSLGILPMWFLSTVYHPHNLFGISNGGTLDFTTASFDAFLFSAVLLLVQYIIYVVIKRVKRSFK